MLLHSEKRICVMTRLVNRRLYVSSSDNKCHIIEDILLLSSSERATHDGNTNA